MNIKDCMKFNLGDNLALYEQSATLIDNILLKFNNNTGVYSGVINTNISKHFPILCSISYEGIKSMPLESLTFEHRKFTNQTFQRISSTIEQGIDREYLNNVDVNEAFKDFTNKLTTTVD